MSELSMLFMKYCIILITICFALIGFVEADSNNGTVISFIEPNNISETQDAYFLSDPNNQTYVTIFSNSDSLDVVVWDNGRLKNEKSPLKIVELVNNLYSNSSPYTYCPDIRDQLVEAIYKKNNNLETDVNSEDSKFGKLDSNFWNSPMMTDIARSEIQNQPPTTSNRFRLQKKVINRCTFG